jgi:CubicO group peptidase (beta-lactamase class C family)
MCLLLPIAALADTVPTLEQRLETAAEQLDLPLQVDVALVADGEYCSVTTPTGPPDATLRFHAASITKLLTAVVVFSLEEDGLLSIDDPVADYVAVFDSSPVTIGQLLTHTSGLRDRQRVSGRESAEEVGAYIEALASQASRVEPGTRWHYADAGYNLLGIVIESASGLPYVDTVVERVLEPLGMRDSTFFVESLPDTDRVRSFNQRGRAFPHPWDRAFLPSSGLQTTAADLTRFANAVLAIANGDESSILKPETLARMTAVQVATDWPGISQGYGFQLTETPVGRQWRHAGGERGFESLLTIYPDRRLALALLGNREDWPRFEFERAIRDAVLETGEPCY